MKTISVLMKIEIIKGETIEEAIMNTKDEKKAWLEAMEGEYGVFHNQ